MSETKEIALTVKNLKKHFGGIKAVDGCSFEIPKGKISTYKIIAKSLNTKAYRAVGNAMAKNPNPIVIPCHRVIKSDGSIGRYALGSPKKISLLRKEGIPIQKGKIVNYNEYNYTF